MSLRHRLVEIIKGSNLELNIDLKDDTSLIKSGFFDSLALLNLATWIEQEINKPIDITSFDLSKEWDTVADILKFIEKHRGNNSLKDRKKLTSIGQENPN